MLTATLIKSLKAKNRVYRKFDKGGCRGFYIEVSPTGGRFWRFKYYLNGKERRLTIGSADLMPLDEARERAIEAKRLVSNGSDPCAIKKEQKAAANRASLNTFEAVARDWHQSKEGTWTEGTAKKVLALLEANAFPEIGSKPIERIKPHDMLDMLQIMEKRGVRYNAGRVRQICGQIFRDAALRLRLPVQDVTVPLRGALLKSPTKHYAAVYTDELPDLLLALYRNLGRAYPQTIRATLFIMLTCARTTETIKAKWTEIDFSKKQWVIPTERMKMGGHPHIVPLSKQALAILEAQKSATAQFKSPYIWPSIARPKTDHISNNTVLSAIKDTGFKGKQTTHGFRRLLMTIAQEKLHYPHDIPDLQLAHEKTGVRASYDMTRFLPERKKMMQEYADYLTSIAPKGLFLK